jgi:hypothetical protein
MFVVETSSVKKPISKNTANTINNQQSKIINQKSLPVISALTCQSRSASAWL